MKVYFAKKKSFFFKKFPTFAAFLFMRLTDLKCSSFDVPPTRFVFVIHKHNLRDPLVFIHHSKLKDSLQVSSHCEYIELCQFELGS